MDHTKEAVRESIKRREELRKAEVATGGRKKLDAEAEERESSVMESVEGAPREAPAADSLAMAPADDRRNESESDSDALAVVPPPSPDDYEAASHASHKTVPGHSGSHKDEHSPEGNLANEPIEVFTRESWLKSRDTFFRNPLYKNKFKATRSKQPSRGHVEESGLSESSKSKMQMGRRRSLEQSEGSKTQRIKADVSPSGIERRRNNGSASARCNREDESLMEKKEIDAFMGEPDYTLLVEVYRKPAKFPFGRSQGESPSPVAKAKSYRTVEALRKAVSKARYFPECGHRAISSASPEPSCTGHRKTCDSQLRGLRRQDSCENGGSNVYVVSRVGRKESPTSRKKGTPAHTGGRGPVSHPTNGRVVRLMAMDLDKSKSNAGTRPSRGAEESPSGQGFTAFVPFQGFAAFANQGGNSRADQTSFTRSLESQGSSLDGSRNSSFSRARHDRH